MPRSVPIRRAQANAEVLLWQARSRAAVGVVLAVSWSLFRLFADVPPDSIGRRVLGAPGYALTAGGIGLLYLAALAALRFWLRRERSAGSRLLVGMVTVDTLVLYLVVALVTPPPYYERSLLLSFFVLQLTQLYFGRRLATYQVSLVLVLQLALLATAAALGERVDWTAQGWTLCIYLVGAVAFLVLQGGLSQRLARLVELFGRMEDGEFSLPYEEALDRRPDDVTLAGRAYNRMRAQLTSIVVTDPLSGCVNRRGFDDALGREVARAARSGQPLTLVAVDLDYFKRLNDTFGHLAGDAAIREAAQLLRTSARAGDMVARIGGEEFMLLAPNTDAPGAFHLAQRLVDAFRGHRFDAVKGRIPVTVSIGVVTDDRVAEGSGEDLRARADEALYAAKRNGRNRVVVWTQGLQSFNTAIYPAAG